MDKRIIPFPDPSHRPRRGFWVQTPTGPAHINGDPNMDPKTLEALTTMIELAVKQFGGEPGEEQSQ